MSTELVVVGRRVLPAASARARTKGLWSWALELDDEGDDGIEVIERKVLRRHEKTVGFKPLCTIEVTPAWEPVAIEVAKAVNGVVLSLGRVVFDAKAEVIGFASRPKLEAHLAATFIKANRARIKEDRAHQRAERAKFKDEARRDPKAAAQANDWSEV